MKSIEKTGNYIAVKNDVTWIEKLSRNIFLQKLSTIKKGQLEIIECFDGFEKSFKFGSKDEALKAALKVYTPALYKRLLFGGTIAAGETYMERLWDSPNLTRLIQVFAANRDLQTGLDSGLGQLMLPARKLYHALRRNSISGSEKNIHAHYDLGNDFFELFLDQNWMYSSAIFKNEDTSLDEAQFEKVDRICRKLKLKSTDHVLEIGTGWGGFALHAAKHYGCKVTTTTISKRQFDLANERIKKAGLENQIEVLYRDYRLLEGQYDKLVSIEMIEAVGLDFLETYFEKCSSLLKPDGEFLLQAITIRDQNYEAAKNSVDFIQRYIFPGSGIPSIESIMKATAKKTDFQMAHQEDFGLDYAKTLNIWHERINKNRELVLQLGYPDSLHRMWQFYFSYCEGGFLERAIGVSQIHFLKPENRNKI